MAARRRAATNLTTVTPRSGPPPHCGTFASGRGARPREAGRTLQALTSPIGPGQYAGMSTPSRPPAAHRQFVSRFPRLGEAWDLVNEEGGSGPLDGKTQRLVKLAVAIGAMREGAVHSGVRKARDVGASLAEIEQVVALAASTIGLPASVAVWTWIRDKEGPPAPRKAPRRGGAGR
jgi:alkylhydroperoxidase/carboxymuconolactone decarboxylase family protein YurZ